MIVPVTDSDGNRATTCGTDGDGPAHEARLIDIEYAGQLFSFAPAFGLIVVITAIVIAGFLAGAASARQLAFLFLAALAAFVVLKQVLRNTAVARIKQKVETTEQDAVSHLKQILPECKSLFARNLMESALQQHARHGANGTSFRLAPVDALSPIEPIAVPFEPQPTGEFDLAQPVGEDEPSAVPRGIRRNLLIKGGWVVLIVFGVNVLIGLIDSIQEWRIHPRLVLWLIGLVGLLLVPARSGWMTQWLVVPGGLVRRRPRGLLGRDTDLHLFARTTSLLCLYRFHRAGWQITVADAETAGSLIGTREELTNVLRAWMSALPAPPLDQLSDLAG